MRTLLDENERKRRRKHERGGKRGARVRAGVANHGSERGGSFVEEEVPGPPGKARGEREWWCQRSQQ